MEGQITADKSYSKGNSNSISSKKKFTVRVVKYGSGEVGGGNNRSCGLSVLDQSHLCNPKVLKQLSLTLPVKLKVAPKLALLRARA